MLLPKLQCQKSASRDRAPLSLPLSLCLSIPILLPLSDLLYGLSVKKRGGEDIDKYSSPPQGIRNLERGPGTGLPWLTGACVHLFPTLCSLKSFWQPEIIHGGRTHHKKLANPTNLAFISPGEPVVKHLPA